MSGIRGGRPRMGGHGTISKRTITKPAPVAPPAAPAKTRVLFVCIGNSCRSQMAEAFAKTYGPDVIEAHSAGLAPATSISPLTERVLMEKNVRIHGQFPKPLEAVMRERFDVIVNMSGTRLVLPGGAKLVEWPVPDPIGHKEEIFRVVAAQIEGLVMRLVLELRTHR